nr:hypothetical protein B0A51_00551 [Rachicladosporium sp. CCFEE 5018]
MCIDIENGLCDHFTISPRDSCDCQNGFSLTALQGKCLSCQQRQRTRHGDSEPVREHTLFKRPRQSSTTNSIQVGSWTIRRPTMRSEVTKLISLAPEEIALSHHWIPAPDAHTWRGRQGDGYVSAGGFGGPDYREPVMLGYKDATYFACKHAAGGGEILLLGFGDSYVWSNRGNDVLQVRWTDIRTVYFSLPNQRVRDDETGEWFAAAEAEEDDFEYPDESSNPQVSSGLEEERRQYLEDHGDEYHAEYGSPSNSDSVSPSVADDDLDNLWRLAERGPAQRARLMEIYHAMHARVEFYEAVADPPGD